MPASPPSRSQARQLPRRPSECSLEGLDLARTPSPPRAQLIAASKSVPDLHRVSPKSVREAELNVASQPRAGTCVLTVGCFDLFHRGHAKLLARLTADAAIVVVGVHDDASVRANKGIVCRDGQLKRVAAVQLALRPQDKAFLVRAADPTPYWVGGANDAGRPLDGQLAALRAEGWQSFEYRRGDDMAQFPGRAALEAEGVRVTLLPYTAGVSATKMRTMWGLNMQVLPDGLTTPILALHESYVYAPLRKGLESVVALRLFPKSLLPNHVTLCSVLCALPYAALTLSGYHLAAAALCIFHDLLDRLDGAVAGALRKRAATHPAMAVAGPLVSHNGVVIHDGQHGAYLDAMGDKAFGLLALVALALAGTGAIGPALGPAGDSLPLWWTTIALLKLPLHAALAVVRTQDYNAHLAGKSTAALPAVGVGKLATCAENFGCATASVALGLGSSTLLGRLTTLAAGALGVLSLDMASRSLSHKLRARC